MASRSSSLLLLLLLLALALSSSCGAAAQSTTAVADPEAAAAAAGAAPKPLVPDLELPPPKKQKKKTDDEIVDAAAPAPSPSSPSGKAKRSEGGKGFGGGGNSRRSGPGKRRKDDFDYFLFVRQYDPSVCDSMRCTTYPKRQDFTIHGLWPERLDGSWPQYCDPSDRFDAERVEALLPRLREQWPSFGMGADAQFWGHEWMRHGTCAGRGGGGGGGGGGGEEKSLRLGVDEETYFGAVLDLHSRYPLLPALERAGIVPDDERTYERAAVVAALQADANATGAARPAVHCGSGRRGSGELTEVWICLSRAALEPFDCPDNVAVRRVGKGGETGATAEGGGGCETLKLPKLKARPPPSSKRGKTSNSGSDSSARKIDSSTPKGGFGPAGDAAVTLVAEKSL